jgi:hypothetical protein
MFLSLGLPSQEDTIHNEGKTQANGDDSTIKEVLFAIEMGISRKKIGVDLLGTHHTHQ